MLSKLFVLIPFHVIVALAYASIVYTGGVGELQRVVTSLTLPSGARSVITVEAMIAVWAIFFLTVEAVKSGFTGWGSITNHILSALLFVVAFGLLITKPEFGTMAWAIITLTMLADMAIGIVVTTMSARRDFGIN